MKWRPQFEAGGRTFSSICACLSLVGHATVVSTFWYAGNTREQWNGRGAVEVSLVSGAPQPGAPSHRHAKVGARLRKTPVPRVPLTPVAGVAAPPPAEIPAGGYGEDQVDLPAKLKFIPKLTYPPSAFREGTEGDVVLFLQIDVSGKVVHAQVTASGGNGFDESALEASSRLEFSPAEKNGKPVPVHVHWTCRFRLTD